MQFNPLVLPSGGWWFALKCTTVHWLSLKIGWLLFVRGGAPWHVFLPNQFVRNFWHNFAFAIHTVHQHDHHWQQHRYQQIIIDMSYGHWPLPNSINWKILLQSKLFSCDRRRRPFPLWAARQQDSNSKKLELGSSPFSLWQQNKKCENMKNLRCENRKM